MPNKSEKSTLRKLRKLNKKKNKKKNLNKRKDKNIIEEDRLNDIGLELSRKFSYSKLISAATGKGSEGIEVHGHMQRAYPVDYEYLINKYVLDRACFYARRDYNPEILKLIEKYNINDFIQTTIRSSQDLYFDDHPNITFREILLLTDGPFEKAINWIDNYPWELDGYDTNVQLGPINTALIGWITTHKPIILTLHAPGKNILVHQATADATEIKNLKEDLNTKALHELIVFKQTADVKIQEVEAERDDWMRRYYQQYHDIKASDTRNIINKHESYGPSAYRDKKEIRKKILIWLGIIAVIGIIALTLYLTTGKVPNAFTNSTLGM